MVKSRGLLPLTFWMMPEAAQGANTMTPASFALAQQFANVAYSMTLAETGDKVTRAEPLAAQVNVGNVLMLRGPWNEPLIEEMRLFPNGAFDDQVDALSRAFGELLGAVDASPAGIKVAGL